MRVAFAAALVTAPLPAAVQAQDDAVLLDCLRGRVTLSEARILSRQPYGGSVEMKVTNGLSWAISGLFVEQVVRSPDRAVPWLKDSVSDWIAGGVEPGETRTVTLYFEGLPDDVPADVVLEVRLLDVGDPDGNQMIRKTRIIGDGWTDQKSERECG
jgi:hypothetical protein